MAVRVSLLVISVAALAGRCDVPPATPPAHVLVGHFARVGEVRVFEPGVPLRLFAPVAPRSITFVSEARRVDVEVVRRAPRGEGALLWLAPPAQTGAGRLVVDGRTWRVRFEAETSAAVAEALAAMDDAALDEIAGRAGAIERLAALRARASLAMERGDADTYRTLQLARADAAVALDVPTDAARAWASAAYSAQRNRDFARAERWLARAERAARLDGAEDLGEGDSLARARVALIRSYVDVALGRYDAAVPRLRDAVALAEAHGHQPLDAYLTKALAEALSQVGQHAEALALVQGLAPAFDAMGARPKMTHRADAAWFLARAVDAGAVEVSWAEAREKMQSALTMAQGLQHEDAQLNILANLVWLEYRSGRPSAASTHLETLRGMSGFEGGYGQRLAELVQARLRLEQGSAQEALRLFDLAEVAARRESRGAPSESSWRAAFGAAQALEALGREEAGARYSAALAELEAVATRADLRRARAPFLAERRDLFDAALDYFVATGQAAQALVVTERARALVLADLEQQALGPTRREARAEIAARCARAARTLELRAERRWQVAQPRLQAYDAKTQRRRAEHDRCLAELTASTHTPAAARAVDAAAIQARLAPDEVLISLFGVGARDLRLTVTAADVRADWSDETVPALPSAKHVYLVPGGRFDVGWLQTHWVPTLLERASVSYLPEASRLTLAPRSVGGGKAVVVGDPREDLPFARQEAEAVVAEVGGRLLLGAEADRTALRAALESASFLHYAGHGVLSPDDLWQGHLTLAGEARLTLDDLVVRPLSVERAVLSGCWTGARAALGRGVRLGLVDLLVASGVRTVVAAHLEVDDANTARFMRDFYAAGGRARPVQAYREVARRDRLAGRKGAEAFYVAGMRR